MKLTKSEWLHCASRQIGKNLVMGVLVAIGLLSGVLAHRAGAQALSTTTIQGTVYLANGQPGSGTLHVSWPAFTTAAGQTVVGDSTTVTIPASGFVSINLAPNQGATPSGLYYTAVFYMSDGSVNTQYWTVPAAAQATLAQVQAQVMPAAQAVQAVSKSYVDQAIQQMSLSSGSGLSASGGTLTGPLFLNADPTQPLQAADKHYVDTSMATAMPLTGGTATGPVTALQLGAAYQVDQFQGADFGAKLQACLSAVSQTYGGTCDARNFSGTLSMASNLTIGTGNTTIYLPCATIATANQIVISAGTRNVTLHGCALRGGTAASGNQGGTVLSYSGTGAMVQVGDPVYAVDTQGFHLDNVVISTTAAASATAEGLLAYRTQEMDLESLYFLGNPNQTGMTLDGTGNYTGGTFYDNAFNGFQTAVNAIGHQVSNPATTDWMNASTFVRLHIDCPTSGGNPIAGTYGINLQQGDGNTFTGGDVEGCATALHLGAGAQNNTIVGLRNENSTNQVVADVGSAYNNWMTGGTMFTGQLTDNGTRNSFLDTFHRSFNGMKGDWYGSQQDATVTNHYRLGIASGNERGLLDRYQTDYGYRWTTGLSDATGGEQFYQVLDELNNVYRISIGQYNHGQSSTNNQTVVNSAGTGAVVLNGSSNAGTGGVVFGSGGSSPNSVATINSTGNAQFNGTLQVGGTSTFTGSTTVKNQADAEVDAFLWAGATTGQKESLTYKDWNGNSQWYAMKDASNNWALNSATGGLDSFKAYQSTNGGDTYVNASSVSGAVRVNYENGAGTAFKVYGGNSNTLYANFSAANAIQFPGLAAGSGQNCLQIDNSGYVTNTGTACGSGSSNGTVGSGSMGQIAYYTSTGTTLGGLAAVPVGSGGTGAATAAAALQNLGGISSTVTTQQTMAGPLAASTNLAVNAGSPPYSASCNWTPVKGSMNASSSTFTATTQPVFSSASVGQTIYVIGAGAGGSTLVTTIASVSSSTTATLATAASTSINPTMAYFGTSNDLTAINNALSAAGTLNGAAVPTMNFWGGIANAEQGKVTLPYGKTCAISGTLVMPPGVTLDLNTATLLETSSASDAIRISWDDLKGTSGFYGVSFNNVLNGSLVGAYQGTSTGAGIFQYLIQYGDFENLNISGFQFGIEALEAQYNTYKHVFAFQNTVGEYFTERGGANGMSVPVTAITAIGGSVTMTGQNGFIQDQVTIAGCNGTNCPTALNGTYTTANAYGSCEKGRCATFALANASAPNGTWNGLSGVTATPTAILASLDNTLVDNFTDVNSKIGLWGQVLGVTGFFRHDSSYNGEVGYLLGAQPGYLDATHSEYVSGYTGTFPSGSGCTYNASAPYLPVTFSGGSTETGSFPAQAYAAVNASGQVTGVYGVDGGLGYGAAPTLAVATCSTQPTGLAAVMTSDAGLGVFDGSEPVVRGENGFYNARTEATIGATLKTGYAIIAAGSAGSAAPTGNEFYNFTLGREQFVGGPPVPYARIARFMGNQNYLTNPTEGGNWDSISNPAAANDVSVMQSVGSNGLSLPYNFYHIAGAVQYAAVNGNHQFLNAYFDLNAVDTDGTHVSNGYKTFGAGDNSPLWETEASGDAYPRFTIDASGRQYWGTGSSSTFNTSLCGASGVLDVGDGTLYSCDNNGTVWAQQYRVGTSGSANGITDYNGSNLLTYDGTNTTLWVEQSSGALNAKNQSGTYVPVQAGSYAIGTNTVLPAVVTGYHGTSGTEVQLSDGTGVSGSPAGFAADGSITNLTVSQLNTFMKSLTGCTTAGYVYSPAAGTCVANGAPYPGAGIAVSTGSAWATSLAAPAGTIVGTTDTQTLTNKTIDGVAPATMAFVDATSSIQTQLNGKQTTLTNPVTGPGSGATTGDLAQMGNAAGTQIADSGVSAANVMQTTTTPAANQLCVFGSTAKTCTPTTTLPAAAEPVHTGDVTNTAGSLAMIVGKINGAAVPAGANVVATNASSQMMAATSHNLSVPANCATSGSANTYSCATAPSFTPAAGDHIQIDFNAANTGSATLAVNGASAATIKKWGGTATLIAGDVQAGHWISATFDGTYWQLEGQLGNSNANQINGGTTPASAAVVGTNSSSQLVAASSAGMLGVIGNAGVTTQFGGTGQNWSSATGVPQLTSGAFSLYNTSCTGAGSALTYSSGAYGCNSSIAAATAASATTAATATTASNLGGTTQYGVPYQGASASTSYVAPQSVNGTYFLGESVTSNAATAPSWVNAATYLAAPPAIGSTTPNTGTFSQVASTAASCSSNTPYLEYNGTCGSGASAGSGVAYSNPTVNYVPMVQSAGGAGTLTNSPIYYDADNTLEVGIHETTTGDYSGGTWLIVNALDSGNDTTGIIFSGVNGDSIPLVDSQTTGMEFGTLARPTADGQATYAFYHYGGNPGPDTIDAFSGKGTFAALQDSNLTTAGIVTNDSSGNLGTSTALPGGTTATTAAASDNSAKVATTAYVAAPGAIAPTTVTASGIITGGNDTTRVTTTTMTNAWTTTGLVLPTVPAGTTKSGRCRILWAMSSTTYTSTFGLGMDNAPTNVWGGSHVTYNANGTSNWLSWTKSTTATAAISTATTAAATNTIYDAQIDFVVQTGSTNPVTMTIYSETSNASGTLTIEPGSTCYWLP